MMPTKVSAFLVVLSSSILALLALPAVASSGVVASAPPAVTLKVAGSDSFSYQASPGPEVDHLHVYVDGEQVGQTRQLHGNFTLQGLDLPAGEHTVCVDVANRAHIQTGAKACVNVHVG
ncbi:hypothetical protein [Castellaniella sp. UC4442_H9]